MGIFPWQWNDKPAQQQQRRIGGRPSALPSVLRFSRSNYGYDPNKVTNPFLRSLSATSYTGGMGYTNRAEDALRARGFGRSTGVLDAARIGAGIQGDIYTSGAVPFARDSANFAEQQRSTDIGLGLENRSQAQNWEQFIRTLAEQQRQFDLNRKDRNRVDWGGLLGGLIGAGGQVGAAYLGRK